MKPQYFRWYPAEAEADEDWRLMNESQIGLFMVCLNYGFNNNGLPANPDHIWQAIPLKLSKERFTELWPGLVESKFPIAADGRRRNVRQEAERTLATEVSAKRAAAAKVKWSKFKHANAEQGNNFASAPHSYSNSVLDSSSSSDKETTEFSVWAHHVWRRHPNKRDKLMSEQALMRFAKDDPGRVLFDRNHLLWCGCTKWQEKNGSFASRLWEFIESSEWETEPPAANKKPPATVHSILERVSRELETKAVSS